MGRGKSMQTVIGNVKVVNATKWRKEFDQNIWPKLVSNGAESVRSYQDKHDASHISYLLELKDIEKFTSYIDSAEAWQLFVKYGAHPIEIMSEQLKAS